MKLTKAQEKMYDILYAKSRVSSGVRCVNEDEWPIKELASELSRQKKELMKLKLGEFIKFMRKQ